MASLAEKKKAKRDALAARINGIAMLIGSLIFKVAAVFIGLYYMVFGKDKKVKKMKYNPGQILNNPECVEVRRITLYCIRHAESTWNEVFNLKASSISDWMFQFPLKLCEMILTELILLVTPDSILLDAPLSEVGISQALTLSCAIEQAGGFAESSKKISSSVAASSSMSYGASSSSSSSSTSMSMASSLSPLATDVTGAEEKEESEILLPTMTKNGMKEWLTSQPTPIVYCSPLRRCLETMVIALYDLIERKYLSDDSSEGDMGSIDDTDENNQIVVHSSLQELTINLDGISLTGFYPATMPPLSETWSMLCESFQNSSQTDDRMKKFPKKWIKKASYFGKKKNWHSLMMDRIQFDVSLVEGFKSKQRRGDSRVLSFLRYLSASHPRTKEDSMSSEGVAAPPAIIVGHSGWILSMFKMFLPRQARHICRTRKIDNCSVVQCELIVFKETESSKEERFCIDPDSIQFIHGGVTRGLRRPSVVLKSVQSQILGFTGKQE